MRALPIDAQAIAALDRILHEPARLGVVACLALVDEADFVFLQSQTGMTGGNLSSHLKKLEEAGYVAVHKGFHGARPRTTLRLTDPGRTALATYLSVVRTLLASMDGVDRAPGADR